MIWFAQWATVQAAILLYEPQPRLWFFTTGHSELTDSPLQALRWSGTNFKSDSNRNGIRHELDSMCVHAYKHKNLAKPCIYVHMAQNHASMGRWLCIIMHLAMLSYPLLLFDDPSTTSSAPFDEI